MTEVVEAVVRGLGIPPERRAEVFRAAQQICAEELRLARTGFTPAPLAELADRAVRLLPADLGGERIALGEWNEDAPFPEEPIEEAAGAPAGGPFGDASDVFGAPGGPMIERRVPEPLLALSDAPAREESSHDSEDEDETPEEIEFDIVDRSEPRGGKLAVFLLVVAIGGGVWFFAKTRRVPPVPPSDAAAPGAPASATGPSGTTAPSGAVLSGAVPSPAPAEASAAPSVPPPPAIPESRGSTMLSPDWNGAPAWSIHFSSFQRRENAERDAARLAKALGPSLRVVSVNLGKPGLWYRVMLGEYGSREEALAAREALVGKGVSGVGLVYRVEASATSSSAPAP